MAPQSILKKKGTRKTSSGPSEQQDGDLQDSLRKLQRENSLSSEDGRSAFAKARSAFQNTEQEGSSRDLSREGSIRNLTRALGIKKQMSLSGIQFADNVEVNEISRLQESAIDFCFYTEDELSNFRYAAFMEDAGLDPADYD
jgi:hypothetical protein